MKFIPAKQLVADAQKRKYAIPALNSNGGSYDITRAALETAQELRAPLILQVYEPNCKYRGFNYFVNQANFLCDELKITVPVALQVDHGKSLDSALNAMRAGFTSFMFDASHCPLEENIAKTKEVVHEAAKFGVSIEAEVGYVKGNEPSQQKLIGRIEVPIEPTIPPAKTTVDEALRFVDEVDVDMLAVSIGTTHGVYQRQCKIDFDLLAALAEAIPVPLVMHGTCGISIDDISRLSRVGMAKVNFGEPFRFNYIKYFNKLTDEMEHLWHPWKIMQEVKNQIKNDMQDLIKALGAAGRA